MASYATAPVVQTGQSAHARLKPVGVREVKLTEGLLAERYRTNIAAGIPAGWRQLWESHTVPNFYVVSGRRPGKVEGPRYIDSDGYKWLEGACWAYAHTQDNTLKAWIDEFVDVIAASQEEDGYVNTHFAGDRQSLRFTDLNHAHEIYCFGHLAQAAIAHHRVTGEEKLLHVARRFADLLYRLFGPEGRWGACGHPEAEMALVELYRETGDGRYLQLAARMIDARGRKPPVLDGSIYLLDHLPFREQREAVGHAVRALYLYAGAADLYMETGESALKESLDALWQDVFYRKVYVTGGLGARYEGEAFGLPYELPNLRAYAETCAAIAGFMWNWRMLQIEPTACYADWMETALYNSILSGVSLDGTRYFYMNPLESRGGYERSPWFGCACCPPNIHRTLAALPGYLYSLSDSTVYVHFYASNVLHTRLPNGHSVRLQVKTEYPWSGDIEIYPSAGRYRIALRIPGWVPYADLRVNGVRVEVLPGSYAVIEEQWQGDDVIELSLRMPVELVKANPRIEEDRHSAAVRRGPVVYCIEQVDSPDISLLDLYLPDPALDLERKQEPSLLGGVVTVKGTALVDTVQREGQPLYVPAAHYTPPQHKAIQVRWIPYYAWANRGAGAMKVWLPLA
ncbi:MAG: glycoside hydrolase family 127 protein [Armatimonadota bacterium]|nr:glycoside hydrolase family 127 protein [bacterium]MDW8322029.1 glycoside hydrolase family 127 protein [Armatimonadota bacterium]